METVVEQGVEWLQYNLLSEIPEIGHATFLRKGGVSQGSYKSLNLAWNVGDSSQDVDENWRRVQKILEEKNRNLPLTTFHPNQCHGSTILSIGNDSDPFCLRCDGLMTNLSGKVLCVQHADCQAALFYDPQKKVIANVHSGWRGSVSNIYGEAIRQMKEVYGSRPENLLVCISPSLGPEEAEFINYSVELPTEFLPFQIREAHFDFWSISEAQLEEAGILPHHIEIARISNYANPLNYFSYRRDKQITGRHVTCIFLSSS